MTPKRDMDLIREVLDNELVAKSNREPVGMADGVLLMLRDGHPPRVVGIECGLPVLARRIHPRIEKWVRSIGRRWPVLADPEWELRRGRSPPCALFVHLPVAGRVAANHSGGR